MPGKCAYSLFWLWKAGCTVLGTLWTDLKLRWWGVELDGLVKSIGVPRIEKHPGGRIRIGRGCCLRSARCSNVAGIDRPVTLAALGSGVLELGDGCGLSGTVIVAERSVRLGNHVWCGVNCSIYDTDFHPLESAARLAGAPGGSAPVVIEDDVWLGMNVIVLKGVTIGRGTVVAAGSVVTRDLPAGVLAAGVPAKVIRTLHDTIEE